MPFIKYGACGDFGAINNKIHDLFGELPNIDLNFNYSFRPRVDYYADEENIFFEFEMPGIKKDEVKISLKGNILNVSGEKKDSNEHKKSVNLFKSERSFGPFSRSFQLSDEIDPEKVTANFEDGILKIVIAKALKKTEHEKEIKIN